MAQNTMLITGGAGFIGSNIARKLLAEGKTVAILDNLATGKRENIDDIKDHVQFIEGDVRNRDLLKKILPEVEVIFHQAALGSVPRSILDPFETQSANVDGTIALLWEAKNAGVRRVTIAGSSSVYGDAPGMPRVETIVPSPISPYALTKMSQEHLGAIFSKTYGLECVTLRYFNIFGPFQDPQSEYAAVIPRFITRIIKNEPITIYGDGLQSRDFTFIDNVVSANLLAAQTKTGIGQAANIGCGAQFTLLDLVDELKRLLGKPQVAIDFQPARAGDPRESRADIKKAGDLLGYRPLVDFSEGLRRTVEWFKART